jgi:hypothetical protein
MSDSDIISSEVSDYIALATLNCPPVNALDRDCTSAGAAKLR